MATIYYTAASLDGFIADPDHSLDWLLQLRDPEGLGFQAFLDQVGALAMGATTYRWLLDHRDIAMPEGWPYRVPAWVFSHRPQPGVEGADIRFVSGEVGPPHREMLAAAGHRDLWIVGGGDLAGQFHDLGLLDRIVVSVASVTLGGGAPLLPRRLSRPLRLVSVERFGTDFAQLTYEIPHDPEGA